MTAREPHTSARPALGRTSPQAIFTSVDLPAPFGPSKPTSSPSSTSSSTPPSAVTDPYRFSRPRTASAGRMRPSVVRHRAHQAAYRPQRDTARERHEVDDAARRAVQLRQPLGPDYRAAPSPVRASADSRCVLSRMARHRGGGWVGGHEGGDPMPDSILVAYATR